MSEPVQRADVAGAAPGGSGVPGARVSEISLRRVRVRALIVAGAMGAVAAIGGLFDPVQLLRSYLVGYVFWLSVSLGCLAIAMVSHVVSGGWNIVLRRPLEAASRTLGLMALLFVPILVGARRLYPWAGDGAASEHLGPKAAYLNLPFFSVRAVIYFAVWMAISATLSRMSLREDLGADPELPRRLRKVAAVGLVAYCVTMTLASIDWMMSLNPHWYSTIYGVYVIGGQAVSGMAFAILVALFIAERPGPMALIGTRHFHDFGKMLLAFVMLWAYFAISQFLIIWAGNLPEDIPYYVDRLRGGYRWLSAALFVLHFALPFMLLLSRDLKRNARALAAVAGLLFVVRWVDLYWLVGPAFRPGGVHVSWLDPVVLLAIGGAWTAVFVTRLGDRPIVPLGEPELKEALDHG